MKSVIKFRTLTPIWTGDIDRKCIEIKESGIIGSLRWWFEAIARGLGYFACDPTEEDKCPLRKRDEQSSTEFESYCIACLIFGATGIRRLFRLEIDQNLKRCFHGTHVNIKPKNRRRGWYLGSGLVGEFNIRIVSLNSDFDEGLILLPFVLISKWGGLGAKTQHGYGVVELENGSNININISDFKDTIDKIKSSERLKRLGESMGKSIILRTGNNKDLPNIKDMFFAKIQFEVKNDEWWKKVDGIKSLTNNDIPKIKDWVKSGSVPIAPAIKNWLRFEGGKKLWLKNSTQNNYYIEKWLFGASHKFSSKINISCAYKISDETWEFRIWGWIPRENLPDNFNRDNFLNSLKNAIQNKGSIPIPWTNLLGKDTQNHRLIAWIEYNSPRSTIKQNEDNINEYIQSILVI